jgi:hypothetical protein
MIKDCDSPYDGRHEGAARLGQDRHFTGSVSQYHGGCGPLSSSRRLSGGLGDRQDQRPTIRSYRTVPGDCGAASFPLPGGPPCALPAPRPLASPGRLPATWVRPVAVAAAAAAAVSAVAAPGTVGGTARWRCLPDRGNHQRPGRHPSRGELGGCGACAGSVVAPGAPRSVVAPGSSVGVCGVSSRLSRAVVAALAVSTGPTGPCAWPTWAGTMIVCRMGARLPASDVSVCSLGRYTT